MKKVALFSALIVLYIAVRLLEVFTVQSDYRLYNSFVKLAARTRAPFLCNLIFFGQSHGDYTTSAAESRYFCKADYGGMRKDINYCNKLNDKPKFVGTISHREKCFNAVAEYARELETCDLVPQHYDYCLYNLALNTNDVDTCFRIQEKGPEGLRYNCLLELAKKRREPSICQNLSSENMVYACISDMAVHLREPDYCSFIEGTQYASLQECCIENASKQPGELYYRCR